MNSISVVRAVIDRQFGIAWVFDVSGERYGGGGSV